jgi:hypothetical protein
MKSGKKPPGFKDQGCDNVLREQGYNTIIGWRQTYKRIYFVKYIAHKCIRRTISCTTGLSVLRYFMKSAVLVNG